MSKLAAFCLKMGGWGLHRTATLGARMECDRKVSAGNWKLQKMCIIVINPTCPTHSMTGLSDQHQLMNAVACRLRVQSRC
jgi:hypothetical protein